MTFDDLHDPDPPRPGMCEFAIVAERANAIRRRRAQIAVRSTCVVLALGAAITLAFTRFDRDDGGMVPADTPSPTVPVTSLTQTTTTSPPAPTGDAAPILLAEASLLTGLPPIEMSAVPIPIGATGRSEIVALDDGQICTRTDVGPVSECAPAGVGLYAVDENLSVTVVADDEVRLNFLVVGATCSRTPLSRTDVVVWTCNDLDVQQTTAEVRDDGIVVIASEQER